MNLKIAVIVIVTNSNNKIKVVKNRVVDNNENEITMFSQVINTVWILRNKTQKTHALSSLITFTIMVIIDFYRTSKNLNLC